MKFIKQMIEKLFKKESSDSPIGEELIDMPVIEEVEIEPKNRGE